MQPACLIPVHGNENMQIDICCLLKKPTTVCVTLKKHLEGNVEVLKQRIISQQFFFGVQFPNL